MAIQRALVRLQVARSGGAAVDVTGMTSGAVAFAGDAVTGGAVVTAGVAWGTAAPGLASMTVSVEGLSALPSSVRAALRAGEEVLISATAGDGLAYYGTAYLTGDTRGGEAGGADGVSLAAVASGGPPPAEMGSAVEVIPRPFNLEITADDGTTVSLAWDKPDTATHGDVDGYAVYGRAASGAPWSLVEAVPVGSLADADNPTWDVANLDGPRFVVAAYRTITY